MTDITAIKEGARGRWKDILAAHGVDPAALDGRHHATCPKCGTGKDRFRAFDDFQETGGVVCNTCGKFSDGFEVIKWLTGCDFNAAVRTVADHLGIKPKQPKKQPDDGLAWMDWSSDLAALYRATKPGVQEEAFHLVGARMARYKRRHTVIALPVIGSSLDVTSPANYVCINASGGTLPTFSRKGEPDGAADKKVTGGKAEGLLGVHAVERLKLAGMVEVVWKVEGVSDLLAMQAFIPPDLRDRHVVVTSAFGASEDPKWMADILAKAGKVYCLGDADEDGEAGAMRWARAVAAQKKEGATVVRLPYEKQPKRGKDVRDFIVEQHTYDGLLELADDGEQIVVQRDEEGNRLGNERIDTHFERKICRDLQIEVLGEFDGRVKVYTTLHSKEETIADVSKLTYERLLQICGPPVKEKVHTGSEDVDGMYRIKDVKHAIALIAGYRRVEQGDEHGRGICMGRDLDGEHTNTLILVNARGAARWNGDQQLREVKSPRVDGLMLDLNASHPWYDFQTLSVLLESARSRSFCEKAIQDAIELFRRWRWRNQETDPTLIAGLAIASWVQSIWVWRPLVSLQGRTNSGKSLLMQALGGEGDDPGIFGHLALPITKPTEAGLRQAVGTSSAILMMDEFEKSKDREFVLELLRTSGRGSKVARGTANQRGIKFGLRHIVWVAAIETGLTKGPDRNRFISFELLAAETDKRNKLRLPPSADLEQLGQRLLAVAIMHGLEARELAIDLKDTQSDLDPRLVESYAVPAAMLATATGLPEKGARQLLVDLLESVDVEEQAETDEENIQEDMGAAPIFCGGQKGQLSMETVAARSIAAGTSNPTEYVEHLHRVGLTVVERDGQLVLFVRPRIVRDNLLRHLDQYRGVDLRRLLMRLPGAEAGAAKIKGRSVRGIFLPSFDLKAMNDDGADY